MKLHTHIHKTTVTALCILSLGPALLFAADPPQPSVAHGTIKSVDMAAHTLVFTERKDNTEHMFQWNDQTQFTERGQSATASALKEGERVQLTYAPGTDTPILQSVHIAPARTGRHSANNSLPARISGA
jgi:Cu/Ag efflux protein CusF